MIIKTYTDAQATAKAIINELLIPSLQQGQLSLAVSGGSTPKLLFELMASEKYREQIKWQNLHLYWVDERCVPPTDQQSNYGMTAQALALDSLPLPSNQVYRIKGESEPELEAQRYTELVNNNLSFGDNGLPSFGLIILGIGDDGHTSSIFPHQMHWLDVKTPYVVSQHPSGQNRICLTGQTILAAKRLIFHACGANKREILQQIQSLSPSAKAYPSTYFAEHRPDLILYTDQTL